MTQLTHGSLFAGIGGFDLGFERAGMKSVWQVEIDPFCRKVLERHFPHAERFADIRECGAHNLSKVDVITGGFPCQPFSTAGRRQAVSDDRYLWPEMLRIIRALRPSYIVGENVSGLANEFDWVLEDVLDDLEAEGYETIPPIMVPACAFGAWHRRDRIWIIAHIDKGGRGSQQEQQQEERAEVLHGSSPLHADIDSQGRPHICGSQESAECTGNGTVVCGTWWDAEPAVGRVVHGVRTRLDKRRVESLGNAIVPQIAEWIGRRIVETSTDLLGRDPVETRPE